MTEEASAISVPNFRSAMSHHRSGSATAYFARRSPAQSEFLALLSKTPRPRDPCYYPLNTSQLEKPKPFSASASLRQRRIKSETQRRRGARRTWKTKVGIRQKKGGLAKKPRPPLFLPGRAGVLVVTAASCGDYQNDREDRSVPLAVDSSQLLTLLRSNFVTHEAAKSYGENSPIALNLSNTIEDSRQLTPDRTPRPPMH